MESVQSQELRHSNDSGVSSVESESDDSPGFGTGRVNANNSDSVSGVPNPANRLHLSTYVAWAMEQVGVDSPRKSKSKPPPLQDVKTFRVQYLGNSMLDRRYTQPMLPWVMAEIRRKGYVKPIHLQVMTHSLRAIADNESIDPLNPSEIVFEHKLQTLTRFARAHQDLCCFAYLTRTSTDAPFCCFVFEAYSEEKVKDLFNAIRVATKDSVKEFNKDRACEMKPGSHFYEVMYTGKVIVSQRKAHPTFIDESVDKFHAHELERRHRLQADAVSPGERARHNSGASTQSLPTNLEQTVSIKENELTTSSAHSNSADSSQGSDTPRSGHSEENLVEHHSSTENLDKSDFISKSDDSLEKKVDTALESSPLSEGKRMAKDGVESVKKAVTCDNTNKTMIFQIATQDISFISLDKKSIILERKFKDISFCSQGTRHPEHFGFISRDPKSQKLICYVFRCASESVVSEVMQSLKTAFHNAFQQSTKNHVVCEQCPMHQLHKLCQEIDGQQPEKVLEIIKTRVEGLQDRDYNEVLAGLTLAAPQSHQETNEVLMTQLRVLCETRQKDHVHISDANKNDVKNEFNLTGVKTSKFDLLKSKAKKSLAASFDNFFQRTKKDETKPKELGHSDSETSISIDIKGTPDPSPCTSPIAKNFNEIHDLFPSLLDESPRRPKQQHHQQHQQQQHHHFVTRPRAATVGDVPQERKPLVPPAGDVIDVTVSQQEAQQRPPVPAPRKGSKMYMLSKAGETLATSEPEVKKPTVPLTRSASVATPIRRRGSWRQAIFNRVVTPVRNQGQPIAESGEEYGPSGVGRLHTSESIRGLWRKAIMETLLLIRMEKENQNLQAHQDEAESLRVKLDYEEVTPCLKDVTIRWDSMLSDTTSRMVKVDRSQLVDIVKSGVPRRKRGEIWEFLTLQHKLSNPGLQQLPQGIDHGLQFHDLLRQLTTHQHSILIDLGRTFPSHPYFSSQTGAGQLALFNLLKAYSLLDKEVGYCQGLSFVAGFLLMHVPEERSFEMFKYIMFQLGFRRQYKPDMVALQIQMYQLSRLLHDHHKDLYEHFENNEIVPTLYAAPWFLTLFASQFPLGFVARVFDLIFVFGMEVIFKVALIILGNNKELLMQCDSFESIVQFLKTTLPGMDIIQMERVFNQVFALDITQELQAYEVEYHVLQEEMVASPRKADDDDDLTQKLETANTNLRRQNAELIEQLRTAHSHGHAQEQTIEMLQTTSSKLQQHVHTLEVERAALLDTVSKLKGLIPKDILEQENIRVPEISPSYETLALFANHGHLMRAHSELELTEGSSVKTHRSGSADAVDLQVANFTHQPVPRPRFHTRAGNSSESTQQPVNRSVHRIKEQISRPSSIPK